MADEHIDQPWLNEPGLQALLALLGADGEEARIAGGAVRNALMGVDIGDIDISTTMVPRDVTLRLTKAGHKVVPTGIAHGTVTVVIDGNGYEVTTLRQDIETDGRHARVLYGRDWTADARRRDLTMNALYADAQGRVFDPLNGLEDVLARRVRFVDDAETRIREDYLRILRFFRFFAWYGEHRPDADGLKASARLKDGLKDLSVERVWQELSKLLAAPDPSRALLWMRQTGVLSVVLPETEKWGIDALPALIATESQYGWSHDPLLRLMTMLPPAEPTTESLAKRLKLSNIARHRLVGWVQSGLPDAGDTNAAFSKHLYRGNERGIQDRLQLAIAARRAAGDAKAERQYLKLLKQAQKWQRPTLPVRGQDLLDTGIEPGPNVARELAAMEERWVESGFSLGRDDLLAQLT